MNGVVMGIPGCKPGTAILSPSCWPDATYVNWEWKSIIPKESRAKKRGHSLVNYVLLASETRGQLLSLKRLFLKRQWCWKPHVAPWCSRQGPLYDGEKERWTHAGGTGGWQAQGDVGKGGRCVQRQLANRTLSARESVRQRWLERHTHTHTYQHLHR